MLGSEIPPVNLEMTKGTTRTFLFGPVFDADTGDYEDLAGATARWKMGKSPDATGSDVYVTRDTSGNGIVITSEVIYTETAYTVQLTLVPADTASAPPSLYPNRWFHQLEIIKADGSVVQAADGYFTLLPTMF